MSLTDKTSMPPTSRQKSCQHISQDEASEERDERSSSYQSTDDYKLVHTREEDAGHSPKSRYAACVQSQRNKRGGLAWHDILNRPALKPSKHHACLGALRNSAFKTTVRLHGPLPACPIRRPNREHSPVLSLSKVSVFLSGP